MWLDNSCSTVVVIYIVVLFMITLGLDRIHSGTVVHVYRYVYQICATVYVNVVFCSLISEKKLIFVLLLYNKHCITHLLFASS